MVLDVTNMEPDIDVLVHNKTTPTISLKCTVNNSIYFNDNCTYIILLLFVKCWYYHNHVVMFKICRWYSNIKRSKVK